MLDQIKNILLKAKSITKILSFLKIPIPDLTLIKSIIDFILITIKEFKEYVISFNVKKSKEIIIKTEEITRKIEEEEHKSTQDQNNDELRNSVRKRYE